MPETHDTPLSQAGATEFLLSKYHQRTKQMVEEILSMMWDYMDDGDWDDIRARAAELKIISDLIAES